MPKVHLGPAPDPREAETKAVIAAGMQRSGVTTKCELAKLVHMPNSTLSRHMRDIREMRLGELWDILDKLKIPAEDRNKIV